MLQLSREDQASCLELFRDLVRTRSYSGQEGQFGERLAEEMRRVGFQQVYRDRIGNVIGRLSTGERSKGGSTRLLFNGHMDTVGIGNPGAWTHDPFGADLVDGLVYGRGTVDMKGALAAMIYGAKLLIDAKVPLNGELIMAAVVQEEPCEGMAMQVLVEEEGLWPSYVVLGEPTNLDVAIGQRGRVQFNIKVEGKACHASQPSLGENALYSAARLIFGIELLAPQLAEDSVLGKGTIAVTNLLCANDGHNMVPDLCELVIDRRLTLSETRERAMAEIRQIMKREGVRGSIQVASYRHSSYLGYVREGQEYYPPWLMPDDSPLVRRTVRAVERVRGLRPRLKIWEISTDGAYTRGAAGIPTVGFGPGEERLAHTADEHIRAGDVLLAAAGYAQIAAEILGKA